MKRPPVFWTSVAAAIIVIGATIAVWRAVGHERSWFLVAIFVDLNLLALAVPGYFVVRRLTELIAERRRMVPGSRFKTRLVATMAFLVSGPVIIVFLLSSRFVTNTVDRWFGEGVERPLKSAVEVGRFLYQREQERVLAEATLHASNPLLSDAEGAAGGRVQWFSSPPLDDPLVATAFLGRADTEIVSATDGSERVRAAAPRTRPDGSIAGVVVVQAALPRAQIEHLTTIRKSFEEHRQVGSVRGPVKAWYIVLLGLFTVVTLVLAIGTGLFLSKGITAPIQSLIEGTERVARGETDVRVETPGDDEMLLLTESFNRMVAEIQTNREQVELAYRESHSRRLLMEAIIENINTGVIFLDEDAQVDTINNAACRILGISPNELFKISVRKILDRIDSGELRDLLHGLRDSSFQDSQQQIRAVIQGRPVVLSVYLSNLRDPGGNPTGVLVVFEDLTELIKAQRAYAWQEVARRMAHEIKNPLTPIKLSAERLRRKFETTSADFPQIFPEAIKTIIREVEYLRSLVNEFSRLGKLPDLRIRADDPRVLLHEIGQLYRDPAPPLVIDVRFREVPETVEWDRDQVHRALINLIDNAIEATGRAGEVGVEALPGDDGQSLVLVVEDDGPGIPPGDRELLFSPHFSRKKEGTGLGLAIVQKIVTDHRGTIDVEDRTPRGTRFILRFPCFAA